MSKLSFPSRIPTLLLALSILLRVAASPVCAADPAPATADAGLKAEYEALSPDQLAQALFDNLDRFVTTLESINDAESARKAKPKLVEIQRRMEIMTEVGEGMEPEMSEQEEQALEEKYTPRMEALMARMMPAMMRIAGDEAVQKELGDFFDSM